MKRAALFALLILAFISCGQCPTPPDPGTVKVKVCGESLLLPTEWCPDVVEKTFTAGNQPTETCTLHHAPITTRVIVCAESGLLPNAYCPTKEEREFIVGQEPTEVCAVHKAPTKVAHPWKPGEFLAAWSPLLYSDIAYAALDETKLDALCEAMAVDGGNNARRWFAFYADAGTAWAGTGLFPWNADWTWNETYWAQLDRRVNMWAGKRDGTEIISILDACSMYEDSSWPANPLSKLAARPAEVYWPGPARDKVIAFAVEMAKRVKKYTDRCIIETRNEGEQIVGFDALQSYDDAMIAALLASGWPVERIQIEWYDSSMYYATLSESDHLAGRGLAATHQICSPEDLSWYENSPGKQGLAALGDYPCSDGPGFDTGAPQGLKWFWLPGGEGRRPSNDQIRSMAVTAHAINLRGVEFLSASAFQKSGLPDIDDAITVGRDERKAMLQASLSARAVAGDRLRSRKLQGYNFGYLPCSRSRDGLFPYASNIGLGLFLR